VASSQSTAHQHPAPPTMPAASGHPTSDASYSEATFATYFQRVVDNIGQVIQGKRDVIELVLLCLISEGHLLLEDVPGVGKTSLAKSLAASLDASFGRVQFTPDLLPSDVAGLTVWNRADGTFNFRPGPIFNNVVLADEINRASPKTQAALLEAMAETQVTVDGATYPMARPFMVIATQNPIEHEGTYPLPESQLDRFLMRVSVGYPSPDAELEILDAHAGHDPYRDIGPVLSTDHVIGLINAARRVHIAPSIRAYLVELINATRHSPHLTLGASPRATLALGRVARARAAARGRGYVIPDDVKALADPVLSHRLLPTPEAQFQGIDATDALAHILASVPIPTH
jgi:MoxR-like ATPase